jgi:hypothetical protein
MARADGQGQAQHHSPRAGTPTPSSGRPTVQDASGREGVPVVRPATVERPNPQLGSRPGEQQPSVRQAAGRPLRNQPSRSTATRTPHPSTRPPTPRRVQPATGRRSQRPPRIQCHRTTSQQHTSPSHAMAMVNQSHCSTTTLDTTTCVKVVATHGNPRPPLIKLRGAAHESTDVCQAFYTHGVNSLLARLNVVAVQQLSRTVHRRNVLQCKGFRGGTA